jgi:hypothetical protein
MDEALQSINDRLADYLSDLHTYELGRNEVRRIKACAAELLWVLRLLET